MIVSKPAFRTLLFSPLLLAASCSTPAPTGNGTEPENTSADPFSIEEMASLDEGWGLAFEPGTGNLFVTEKAGTMKFYQPSNGRLGTVSEGLPEVSYGGQGGFGDIAFAPDYAESKRIYLSWVEAGEGETRGAVLGRGKLICEEQDTCKVDGLEVIWRQTPKVEGGAHFSHRIAFSPDGQYMFVSSGERAKEDPAQDLSNNLGTILRLLPDGTPAPGNPFEDRGGVSAQIWSYGHRNVLGLDFDEEGRLWDVEHGPRGGDELNLVKPGQNYGWPLVSGGVHYNGDPIPDHSTRPDLAGPAVNWTPVIAPGDFLFYEGSLFSGWQGDALITGLGPQLIVRVEIDGEDAQEVARYEFESRIRDIAEDSDGALWIVTDGPESKLLKLTPKS